MYRRAQAYVAQRIATLGPFIVAGVVVIYVVSQFVPSLSERVLGAGFFSVVIIALLVDVLMQLAEPERKLTVLSEWEESRDATIEHIRTEKPERADLLEYSCWNIDWLLSELKRAKVEVRLLMAHPGSAVSEFERKQIEQTLTRIGKEYGEFEVRLYSVPAGLRGRRIGTFLALGWYTYAHTDGELSIFGHKNATLLTRTITSEGDQLKQMFERTFSALWEDREGTLPLSTYARVGAPGAGRST
jgi:hypothetical protein